MAIVSFIRVACGALGLVLCTGVAQAFQPGQPGGGGGPQTGPLNLLSPAFVAPLPRAGSPAPFPGGASGTDRGTDRVLVSAPLPSARPQAAGPRPSDVPPAPVQALVPPTAAEAPRQAVMHAVQPIAATGPAAGPVTFVAPLPQPRMAARPPEAPVAVSAAPPPVQPIVSSRGTSTTMVIPATAGAQPTIVQNTIIGGSQSRPTGPVLASLPSAGARDWPRFVPGARSDDRNTGPAGERIIPDPGVRMSCLPAPVRRALNDVALRFGTVLLRSTLRGSGRFVRRDPFRGSYHRDCRAADFRLANGSGAGVLAFLRARPDLGGVKRYRNGLFHIDDGPRRSW